MSAPVPLGLVWVLNCVELGWGLAYGVWGIKVWGQGLKINIFRVSGVFTAPRAGVYLITFSYQGSNDAGEASYFSIYKNGAQLLETLHGAHFKNDGNGDSAIGQVASAGGWAVYQRLEAWDTLTLHSLQTILLTGEMSRIIFCIQFINS